MDDLISRQDAIEAVEKESQIDGAYGYMDTKSIIDLLNDLPSAETERKTGKWIYTGEDNGNGNSYCNCSICGAGESHSKQVKVRYCWNCGAKMEDEKIGEA